MNAIAKTYASEEHDRPAQEVRGKLTKRWVDPLQYWQYFVDGVGVDPVTIKEDVENAFCPTGEGGGQDDSCSAGGSKSVGDKPEEIEAFVESHYKDSLAAIETMKSERIGVGTNKTAMTPKQAVNYYAGGASGWQMYRDVNDAMRDKSNSKFDKNVGGQIQKVISTCAPLDKPITVYRSATLQAFGGKVPAKGDTFEDKGFVSTTMSKQFGSNFYDAQVKEWGADQTVLMEIELPKGTRALPLSYFIGERGGTSEHELLLGAGHSFEVESVSKSGGKTVAKVRMKAPKGKP